MTAETVMKQMTEVPKKRVSLVEKMAGRFSIDADKLLDILKATSFRQSDGGAPSNEQMAALLVVADQYGLNPFTKEIYAFSDKRAGIVPVVGVDGWSRIINEHPASDGFEFKESEKYVIPEHGKSCPEWMEVVIHRKDRTHPIIVREYIDEVYRPPFIKDSRPILGPWQTHTKRMFRHKVLIQGARIAYGFTGIYDEDEAERIIEMGDAEVINSSPGFYVPDEIKNEVHDKTLLCIENNDGAGLIELYSKYDADTQAVLNRMFNAAQRKRIKDLMEKVK
jgi:phage recombination protein Bet